MRELYKKRKPNTPRHTKKQRTVCRQLPLREWTTTIVRDERAEIRNETCGTNIQKFMTNRRSCAHALKQLIPLLQPKPETARSR